MHIVWHSNLHIILHESGAVKPEMHFSPVRRLLTGGLRLSDAWREIYCNSRARRIRTWQIAVFALMIVEAAVMAIAVHPAYWVGAGLLALLCVRQLFDRRPERHSVAGVVLYGVIAVLIGIFAVEQVL